MNEPLLPPEAGLDLTRAILARTSGPACQRLHNLACAFVDGELDSAQGGLVRLHLASCPSCQSLVGALIETRNLLPALAQTNPGPWFTQRVMRATTRRPAPQNATDRRPLWWKLMHRPRIALEAAYLGAAAGLVGSYLPIPTPPVSLRVPAFVHPLGASAQRVKSQVVQAERRSTLALQQSLRPKAATSAEPRPTLWQRSSAWARARLRAFRSAPPPPAKGNEASPANP
ncbi:MAG: zf-HC2 domain-containing protein [Acidobacteria bacterium]|nr:zf-HC2 domain-containing protein [Acidobacteriota bacterium]MBI3488124.1 zf-HC2 domain-containing protein [Acidobacteriota bacterium]